jgi:hypothetical protein
MRRPKIGLILKPKNVATWITAGDNHTADEEPIFAVHVQRWLRQERE